MDFNTLVMLTREKGEEDAAEIGRLKARISELESRPYFASKSCSFCGEMTDNLSGSPGMWSLVFPDPGSKGRTSHHHVKCVMDRMLRTDPPAAAAIDPDMPMRFRFPVEESHGIEGGWRYAVYFPRNKRWTTEYAYESRGRDAPDMPGLEWIDPAPTPKETQANELSMCPLCGRVATDWYDRRGWAESPGVFCPDCWDNDRGKITPVRPEHPSQNTPSEKP